MVGVGAHGANAMGAARLKTPFLISSAVYVARLSRAALPLGGQKYAARRRINWSHRYAAAFYQAEEIKFETDPAAYLADCGNSPVPPLEDVYAQRLSLKQLTVTTIKVLLHWLFCAFGASRLRKAARAGATTFRKAYVDDIELVFDPEAPRMVRGVFPFPLSASRQWRYIRSARQQRRPFALCGNRYGLSDFLHVLLHRRIDAVMRMESRAQLRTANHLARLGFRHVELSDEFDLGSLDFCRRLHRLGIGVVNSAHGVGMYLPWHAYPEFRVLTQRQVTYYQAVFPCQYELRRLNKRGGSADPAGALPGLDLVWLSQVLSRDLGLVATSEAKHVALLAESFAGNPKIRLWYKPHPNNLRDAPAGFRRLDRVERVNGLPGTIYLSFYSTCQIDPSFDGEKLLVRAPLIHPEIVFDESETIVEWPALEAHIRRRLERQD